MEEMVLLSKTPKKEIFKSWSFQRYRSRKFGTRRKISTGSIGNKPQNLSPKPFLGLSDGESSTLRAELSAGRELWPGRFPFARIKIFERIPFKT